MSFNAPLKILRLAQVPFLLFRAHVTSITVVGIILYHSTLILINSRKKALKFLAGMHTSRSRLSASDMMVFSLPSYPRVTAYIVVVARFVVLF